MKLVFAPAARADIAEAVTFIAEDDPRAAHRQKRRAEHAARRLQRFPGLGPPLQGDLRCLQVAGTPFRLVYTVTSDAVVIRRVWHGARQWPPARD